MGTFQNNKGVIFAEFLHFRLFRNRAQFLKKELCLL